MNLLHELDLNWSYNPLYPILSLEAFLYNSREKNSQRIYYLFKLKDCSNVFKIEEKGFFCGYFGNYLLFENTSEKTNKNLVFRVFNSSEYVYDFEIEGNYSKQILGNYFIVETFGKETYKSVYYKFPNSYHLKIEQLWQYEDVKRLYFIHAKNEKSLLFHKEEYEFIHLYEGVQQWTTNVENYLVPSPQYANGEPMYQNQVEKVLYCKKNEVIVVFLLPYKLLGINAQDGQVLWEVDYPLNSKQMHLEEESGLLYVFCLNTMQDIKYHYNIFDTSTGNLVIKKEYDYHDIHGGKESLYDVHFAGIHGNYIYFTDFNFHGELFKLQKDTGEIIERYKHNRPFYAPPQIIGNRLFVSEDTDSKKNQQRLLVFDL